MKTSLRHATDDDRDAVVELFRKLHEELLPLGGSTVPGARTDYWVADAFDVAGAGMGACLVVESGEGGDLVAASLATEVALKMQHTLGKVAHGLGTYVEPEFRKAGLAGRLYEGMKEALRERGYTSYLGGVLPGNKPAARAIERAGGRLFEVGVIFDLVDRGGAS